MNAGIRVHAEIQTRFYWPDLSSPEEPVFNFNFNFNSSIAIKPQVQINCSSGALEITTEKPLHSSLSLPRGIIGLLNMDQQLPPRKRRRPALSCIECRRRKIKCDRNMPCNHCKQSKNSVCSYKSVNSVAMRVPPNPLPANNPRGLGIQSSAAHEAHNAHNFQVEPLPRGLSSLENISESDRQSWFSTSGGNTDGSQSEKSAPGTITQTRRLDRTMGEMSLSQTPPPSAREHDETMSVTGINTPSSEDVMFQDGDSRNVLRTKVVKNTSSNPTQGSKDIICKTRFFGQSHWMFALKQVCQYIRRILISRLT